MKTFLTTLLFTIGIALSAQNTSTCTWLTGTWSGPGFGGTFEETWSEPDANGILMGMFRYTDSAGAVQFYEYWLLDSTGMKLKHFNPDFVGWEEKAGFVEFDMISVTDRKVSLNGLSYELLPTGEMEIRLRMKHGSDVKTEVFLLTKRE